MDNKKIVNKTDLNELLNIKDDVLIIKHLFNNIYISRCGSNGCFKCDLNSEFIGVTETFHELAVVPKPGSYVLTATDQNGNSIKQQLEISVASGG